MNGKQDRNMKRVKSSDKRMAGIFLLFLFFIYSFINFTFLDGWLNLFHMETKAFNSNFESIVTVRY